MANISFDSYGQLEEVKRVARILDIIQNIKNAPSAYNRKRLAAKYEMSERQIQRDLDVIRHGLKLDLQRRNGGYYFASIPHLPTVSYSLSEALSLFLAAQAGQQFGVDSSDLASALSRLESVFPVEFRSLLRALTPPERIGGTGAAVPDMMMLLARALAARRKVRLVYAVGHRQGELSERVVRPYCLLPYDHSWQLVGYCELREELRVFKVDRIHKAEIINESYRIPEDFTLSEAMGSAWGLMWGAAGEAEEISLCFENEAGRWVAEGQWHPSQEVQAQPDGCYMVSFHIGITPEFITWLLQFGARVRILTPTHLRRTLAEEHRKAAAALEAE